MFEDNHLERKKYIGFDEVTRSGKGVVLGVEIYIDIQAKKLYGMRRHPGETVCIATGIKLGYDVTRMFKKCEDCIIAKQRQ